MLLDIDTLLEKWLTLYSVPGRFPLVISKEPALQLLSGIQVSVDLTIETLLLELVLDECSQEENNAGPFPARQVRQAIHYLSRASVKKRLTLEDIYDPTFLDIPLPSSVNVIHLGLPYLPKPELESLYTASRSEFTFPITKSAVKHSWEERYEQLIRMPEIFEHIWGLIDHLDTQELLPNEFFEVSWLFSMKRKGFILPNTICGEMRDLFWEHCISILPQLSVYKPNPSIIMTTNSEQAVMDELSQRLIDQLQERKAPPVTTQKVVKPSKPIRKTKLNKDLAAALRQTLEALSGWKWKSNSPPPEITKLECEAMEEGILEFSETFFKFDWNASINDDWNCKALRSFVLLFKESVNRGDWMSKGITETSINNHTLQVLIKRKWLYLQSLYQKQRTRLIGDQQSKDVLELEEKMRKKRARHVSRRVELYRMRMKTVVAHPEWNNIWRKVVETLDVDGMSSRTFWRIPQVWRNPQLTLILENIDSHYRQQDFRGSEITRMGNLRRKRHGDHPEIVHTEIPSEFYPENFYSLIWLENNRPEALSYLRLTWADKIELPVKHTAPFFTNMDNSDLEGEEESVADSDSPTY